MKALLVLVGVLGAAVVPAGHAADEPSGRKGAPTGYSRMWTGAMLAEQKGWTRVSDDPNAWPGLATELSAEPEARETRSYILTIEPAAPPGRYSILVYVARGAGAAKTCWVSAKFGDLAAEPTGFEGAAWVRVWDAATQEPAARLALTFRAVPPSEIEKGEADEADMIETVAPEPKDDAAAMTLTPKQTILFQGAYVTSRTDEVVTGLGLVETNRPTLVAPAVERAGNYLENSSFEAGRSHGWGANFGASPPLWWLDMWDETTGYDGGCSLCAAVPKGGFRVIESKFYSLPADRKYTLSLWAKAEKPAQIRLALVGCPAKAEEPEGPTWFASQSPVETEWSRVRASGQVGRCPGQYCSVSVTLSAPTESSKVWIDAVQLEEGSLTDYRPREPVEVGTIADVPGHILFEGEPSPVRLALYAPTKPPKPVDVLSRLIDYKNREVWSKRTTATFSDKARVVMPLDLPTNRSGIFRLLNSVDGSDTLDEQSLSVLPRPKALGRLDPTATLGADGCPTKETVPIFKRANFNWVLSKHWGRWPIVEPEQGKLIFFGDEGVKIARDAGLGVVIQTLAVQWGGPEWIRPHAKPSKGPKDNSAPWPKEDRDLYCRAYGDYVYRLVDHYKPWVKHWEIDNEPGYQVTPEEYREILEAAHAAAKKADPECTVIGGSHYYVGWMDGWLANGGARYCDEVSGHYYDSTEAAHELWANRIVDKYKKPAWNSETGLTPGTWYLTLPEPWSASICLADRAAGLACSNLHQLEAVVKNYLISLSFGKFKHYLYYFMRFANASPSQPTRRAGNGKELCEFDGSLRMAAVGLSVASHFLDGAELYGRWTKDLRVRCFVYAKDGGSVGFAWTDESAPLLFTLPAGTAKEIHWYDAMGAPVQLDVRDGAASGRLSRLPCYFTSTSRPPDLLKRLDTMELTLPIEMSARFDTTDRGTVLRLALRNCLDSPTPIYGTLSGPTIGHCTGDTALRTKSLSPGEIASAELPVAPGLAIGSVDFTSQLAGEPFTVSANWYVAAAARGSPTLDGDFAKFRAPRITIPGRKGKVRYGAGNIFGNDWIRAQAAVAYDGEKLYLACDLVDAVVRPLRPDEKEDQGDRVQFLLRTAPAEAPLARTLTPDCVKVMLQLLEGGKIAATLRRRDGSSTALPDRAVSVREKGYTVEVAIAWTKLGLEAPPRRGTYWGFQCEIFNAGSVGGGTDSEIVWSGSAETYDDPSDWGQLRFD